MDSVFGPGFDSLLLHPLQEITTDFQWFFFFQSILYLQKQAIFGALFGALFPSFLVLFQKYTNTPHNNLIM